MKDILFRDGCEYLYEALGISQQRAQELDYRVRCIMYELSKPTRNGVVEYCDSQIMKLYIALGKTDEERIFLAFVAGRQVEALDILYPNDDEIYEP